MEISDIFKICIGAFLALSSGLLTQLFIARQNELGQRIDELIKFIWEYGELAANYWKSPHNPDDDVIESKIVARDHFIGSVLAGMRVTYNDTAGWDRVETSLLDLNNSATGGNFQVLTRKADLERAAKVNLYASELCVRLRDQRRKLIRIRSIFGY